MFALHSRRMNLLYRCSTAPVIFLQDLSCRYCSGRQSRYIFLKLNSISLNDSKFLIMMFCTVTIRCFDHKFCLDSWFCTTTNEILPHSRHSGWLMADEHSTEPVDRPSSTPANHTFSHHKPATAP